MKLVSMLFTCFIIIATIPEVLTYVRTSNAVFIRNGIEYNGRDAVKWLIWKARLPRYRRKIKSAKDFIDKICVRSEKTGILYTVRVNGEVVNFREYLRNKFDRGE